MSRSYSKKALIKKKISILQNEISLLRLEFRINRDNVDEYCRSRFHEELSNLKAKKRDVRNLIFNALAANVSFRDPDMRSLIRRLRSVEIKFQEMLPLLNLKSPLEHVDDVINAVEQDLETNFCLLRQINCYLPYHQHWMHFLTSLTQRDREASLYSYKVSLKEVRLRGHCISSIHHLLALLNKEKSSNQELMSTVQHLTMLNTACEGLCLDLWLRLVKMIRFLERFMSQNRNDRSLCSAVHHLCSWQKELCNGNRPVCEPLSVSSQNDNQQTGFVIRILLIIFALVVILVFFCIFGMLPDLEQYFPFRRIRNEWPRCLPNHTNDVRALPQ